jgi:hypothetical protein
MREMNLIDPAREKQQEDFDVNEVLLESNPSEWESGHRQVFIPSVNLKNHVFCFFSLEETFFLSHSQSNAVVNTNQQKAFH